MAEATKAEIDALHDFATKAKQSADQIQGNLQALLGRLAPVEANYIGQGGQAFGQITSVIDERISKLRNQLYDMADSVQTVGITYASHDQDQGQELRNAQAAISGLTALTTSLS